MNPLASLGLTNVAEWSNECIKGIGLLVGISFEGREDCVRKALGKIKRDVNLQLSAKRKRAGRGQKIGKRY